MGPEAFAKLAQRTQCRAVHQSLDEFLQAFSKPIGAAFLDFQVQWQGSLQEPTPPSADVARFLELADPEGCVFGLTLLCKPVDLHTEVAALAALRGLAAIPDTASFN